MTIEDGNKVIDEFMNYDAFCITSKYDNSWEWIMDVIDEIEKIHDDFHGHFAVHIVSNSCTIQGTNLRTDHKNYHPAYFSEHDGETKIEATWLAVVHFIQWYNKNLK